MHARRGGARPGGNRDLGRALVGKWNRDRFILCAVSISPFETGAFARSHEAPIDRDPAIFALGSSRSLGQQVARHLHAELAPHEEREFEDGEHKTRPLANVRDRDVYVIHISMATRAGAARTSSAGCCSSSAR